MIKSQFTAAALSGLLLVSIGVCAHADPPATAAPDNGGAAPPAEAPSPAPPPTPGIVLHLKFIKGETLVYKCTSDMSGTVSVAGRMIPVDTSSSTIMDEIVEGVRPDGAARVLVRMSDIKMTSQGKPVAITDKMKSIFGDSSFVMDTHANIEGIDINKANPIAGMLGSTSSGSFMNGFSLPEGSLNIGDTWNRTINVPMMNFNTTNAFILQNAWLTNGKQFAAIHSSATGTMTMQPGSAMHLPASMTGPISITGDVILDNTNGVIRQTKTSTHMQMNMNMSIQNPQTGQPMNESMNEEMESDTTQQLLKVVQP